MPQSRFQVSDLGGNVRFFRQARGWSQAELARRKGCYAMVIHRLEKGSSCDEARVQSLALTLNVPISALLRRPRTIAPFRAVRLNRDGILSETGPR